jgi:uncharacterized protein YecE (DUF72 family)
MLVSRGDKDVAAPPIRIGTSSWSCGDWRGPFYPAETRPADFLGYYAERFDTVECDATFYRIPSARTVDGWRARTPETFLFSSKLPREITHERGLVDCSEQVDQYLGVLSRLGPRLGPVVAQFAYVAKGKDAEEYATGRDFLRRLRDFLAAWPRERQIAVEVRNARWVAPPLLDLLREQGAALVLPAIYTMPGPEKLFAGVEPVTSELVYVRFLGDHRRMDRRVALLRERGRRAADWSELAVDRGPEMKGWISPLRRLAGAGRTVLAYFNNHYAGYAPGSAELFRQLWSDA